MTGNARASAAIDVRSLTRTYRVHERPPGLATFFAVVSRVAVRRALGQHTSASS